MALCVLCGQSTIGDTEICMHHVGGYGEDWATGNRIMCDFLHRGIVPPAPCERDEDLERQDLELLVTA